MSKFVIVKIYADLDPVERYARFHKPLNVDLAARGLGEVTGGGTLMDIETVEAIYSDLHVRIDGDLDLALGVIRGTLVRCGSPPADLCVDGTEIAIGLRSH